MNERKFTVRMLEKCVDAYRKGLWSGRGVRDMGLGFAVPESNRMNAIVCRRGACIVYAERFSSNRIGEIARRAWRIASESDVRHVYFDAQGIGAGVGAWFGEHDYLPYIPKPKSDGEMAAGVMNLHARARNTERLLWGEAVDPDNCLFISNKIIFLERFLNELVDGWREIELPHGGGTIRESVSHDATMLAFSDAPVRLSLSEQMESLQRNTAELLGGGAK